MLLQELKIIHEGIIQDSINKIDAYIDKELIPLYNKISELSTKAEQIKDDPEMKVQYEKTQQEIEKLIQMTTKKFNELTQEHKQDKTFLDRIGEKFIETSDWMKENIGISLGTGIALAIPTLLITYGIINRKKIKEHGL